MTTSGSPRPEPRGLWLLRTVVRVGLALIITGLLVLVVFVASTTCQQALLGILGEGDPENLHPRLLVGIAVGAVALTGVLSVLGRHLAWSALAIGYALVAPVLIYLAVDSPRLTRPQTMEEFSPSFAGAEASHELFLRYGNKRPAGRDFTVSKLTWVGFDPQKPEPWIKFVMEHRATIETEWSNLQPVRAWWMELNALERIADLMPPRMDAEIIAFRPVRELSQRGCAMAVLQALDGRGDEAIETLLPLLNVARKLQPSARSLVRQMIAIVIERMSMQTAALVLDRTTVSPAMRARLAEVLAAPGGGEAGASRLLTMEYVFAVNYYPQRPLGDAIDSVAKLPVLRGALNVVSPLVYNRRATMNVYADLARDQEEILARRELDKLELRHRQFEEVDAKPRFKNFAGALLVQGMVPAFAKVAAAYWKAQDERAALLARVR